MRLPLLVFAPVLILGSAAAQPCYAENNTPNFLDNVSMGGPNLLLAVRFTPNVTVAVKAIQVFTGERTGVNTVALWSHDSTGNKPASRLAIGSWSMSSTNSWQGANLDSTVPLIASRTYWMVWGCQNGSQAAVEQKSTLGQPYRGSFNGGASWSGPFQFANRHWKFRLFCKCFGTFELEGAGCKGSNNLVPSLTYGGTPEINMAMNVDLGSAPATRPALLVLGSSKTSWLNIPLPFDLTPLGAPGCFLRCSIDMLLGAATNGSGAASLSFNIPNDTSLICVKFCNQWIVSDPPANTLGLTFSNCGLVTIGG